MEKGFPKVDSYDTTGNDKSSSSNEVNIAKTKDVNSWDRSTLNSNELPKGKTNDWDSSSDCQETMVVPFDNPNDNWDSDSEKKASKGSQGVQLFHGDNLLSYDSSFSDVEKDSDYDGTGEDGEGSEKGKQEVSLLLEDFDEFLREDEKSEDSRGTSVLGADAGKVLRNQSEGTPEDTTIWMIPKTERTHSRESTSKLISSSDRENSRLEKLKRFLKKTKSQSEVHKDGTRRRTARSTRSERLGSQVDNYSNFLVYEGSDLKRKLEIESEKTKQSNSVCESFDRTRVFFAEYECRTMTMHTDAPEKQSDVNNVTGETVQEDVETVADNPEVPEERNGNTTSGASLIEMGRAGPSGVPSMDVLSLPDMSGRKSLKKRKQQTVSPKEEQEGQKEPEQAQMDGYSVVETEMSESWLLLDETGQYQTINRHVVSILLNGRSADDVLQGKKEHFIPNVRLRDTASLKDSLSSIAAQESLQHELIQEDLGGEDDRKRIIDLERKVENTLFYIQPGMNHTASVRIIPLDTEMIHVWRRTRDGGSLLSLEADGTNSSEHSVEVANQRNSDLRRILAQNTVSEEDEAQPSDPTTINRQKDLVPPGIHENDIAAYSRMLFETRNIVDSLTNNFRILQNRLEGEISQNKVLQGEVNRLRSLLKTYPGRNQERNSRESITEGQSLQSNLTAHPSFLIIKENTDERADAKSESIMEERFEDIDSKSALEVQDKSTSTEHVTTRANQVVEGQDEISVTETNEIITVNIYTMESIRSREDDETYSMVRSNLQLIKQKMMSLQKENELVQKQNVELKRKLKEISIELEKYMATTSEKNTCIEEGKELETLRDQVCNLKLELENSKTLVRIQKEKFMEENSSIREESTKSLSLLTTWRSVATEILKKIEATTRELQKYEIEVDLNPDASLSEHPESFSNFLLSYTEQTAQCLLNLKEESVLVQQTLKEELLNPTAEISSLDQVISGYTELIEQCKKGQMTGETETKVMEDYFAVIMEKASLTEEIKILKTENEMLLEGQLQHYEKLKETMIALRERKTEVTALESAQKLLEEERSRMMEVLKLCEEEKKDMESQIMEKSKTVQELMEEMRKRDLEMAECKERLNVALSEINNFEKSCKLKDELINELKLENVDLVNAEGMKSNQIEILKNEIKDLEMQGANFEAELTSSKLFLNESHKEMTDYITHLEGLVNNSQDTIDKLKQKLKESNQTINRLKSENEVMDKQHQCDVKLFNNTKDELESCKERLVKTEKRLKESEEDREKLLAKCEHLSGSEKEKSEALELLSRQYKEILGENADLIEKVQIFSKDKDESLKEQKDLINKYAILSKEIQKLQDKYRNVKSECNERTDLIKYLEMMLKENLLEYNSRIACLEQNISRIIEKIMVYKDGMKGKHFGVDAEVRELRHQLDVTYKERKEMENVVSNYYSLTKRLEQEIQERERKVDELHAKLSLEQQRAVGCENDSHVPEATVSADCLKIEQLESQIAVTDSELVECRKELQRCQTNFENEKRKYELTIADLKSEIKRYQLRIEVMMKNLSNCNKNINGIIKEKRSTDDSEIQAIRTQLQEKNKIITELKDTINKYKAEAKLKDADLESFNKRGIQDEELQNLRNQIDRMQAAMSSANKTSVVQQKEKDEMADKLFQSIKLLMEERSARQTFESLAVEKEKNLNNQLEHIKNELVLKVKECEVLSGELEDKKKIASKLQDELIKVKTEVSSLRFQVSNYKKRSSHRGNGDGLGEEPVISNSLTHIRTQSISSERLESCLRELKEVRDLNLELRKTEGHYQAKIVCLEDEIRDARLLIKELQGDIKTEKKSKKAFKNMIMAAKMEIEKCVLAKQLMSVVAERISRHLDLSEIPSREFLSGFRISESFNSSKYLQE